MTNREFVLKLFLRLSDAELLDAYENLPPGRREEDKIVGICDGCPALASDVCCVSACVARIGPRMSAEVRQR